ncbi:hypothetical protein ACGFZ7_20930 [Pseudomonas sp. NPDC047963]|nr:hypothetical protein [Pseudomonas sp.]|tara:strand:+ start:125 stop:538 length:414 start_codon:yes stop_codon:yes gene_type:complete
MIDFYTWHSCTRIAFLLIPFLIGLSGVAVQAYLTHRYYEIIISAFPNSSGVKNYQRVWPGKSFRSRCLQVGSTGGFILWPKTHIRQGSLDPKEVRNFPPEIKRLMVISVILLFVGFAWLLIGVALLKLSGVQLGQID